MSHSESVTDPGFKLWLRIHALNQQSALPDMNNRNSCLYALFILSIFWGPGASGRAQRTGKILQASINFSIKMKWVLREACFLHGKWDQESPFGKPCVKKSVPKIFLKHQKPVTKCENLHVCLVNLKRV